MIIIYQKSTGKIVRFATNPEKFRGKLESRVFPEYEMETIKDISAVPDDIQLDDAFKNLPTYNYENLAIKYDYIEITDKPKARKIRLDDDPKLLFSGNEITGVVLSTGEEIML